MPRARTKPRRKARGVLSLWTRTPIFRPQRGPLLITSLAAALARRAFPEVHFVSDDQGADIAARLGWKFDHVSHALEHWPDDGAPHVWAKMKLVALLLADAPVIQFDGDVLLLKGLPQRMHDARLCAQSPDLARFYTGRDMDAGRAVLGFPAGARPYNAGLLGGRDVALVHDYAAEALANVGKFAGQPLNGTTASMLCEQYGLGLFAQARGVKVETLLPESPTREQVRRAGYAHLVGEHKRAPHYVAKAEARLARAFPEAYENFLEGWRTLADDQGSPIVDTVWAASL